MKTTAIVVLVADVEWTTFFVEQMKDNQGQPVLLKPAILEDVPHVEVEVEIKAS